MMQPAIIALTLVLAWTMPTTNEDGSALEDLAGNESPRGWIGETCE